MYGDVWIVLSGGDDSTLVDVESVLSVRSIDHLVVPSTSLRLQPLRSPATAAVVVGGVLDPSLLDSLRILTRRQIPALLLVDELTDHQEVLLLGAGAWDVVGVPTSRQRLDGRIAAHYRDALRPPGAPGPADEDAIALVDGVEIRPARREVWVAGAPVQLTRTELDLLLALAEDPERIWPRDELGGVAGDTPLRPRALESHLSRLRLKISRAGGPLLAEPVRGVGYRLHRHREQHD